MGPVAGGLSAQGIVVLLQRLLLDIWVSFCRIVKCWNLGTGGLRDSGCRFFN